MEVWLFIFSILIFVAVLSGKVSYRYGTPALLLFLLVGMTWGNIGYIWGEIQHASEATYHKANIFATIALAIILFSGGIGTKFSSIKPVLFPGVLMATLGVLVTALLSGIFIFFITPHMGHSTPLVIALLIAACMASTDSASVFSILRTKKQGLKDGLRPMLELESGSNDPMAYLMVVMITAIATGGADGSIDWYDIMMKFLTQMIFGAVFGFVIGRLAVRFINNVSMNNESLYSVLLVAFGIFSYAFTALIQGNGYLAIYITGLVIGNAKLNHKITMTTFLDSFMWLLQIALFIVLGTFVDIKEIFKPEVYCTALATAAFSIFVARPVATLLSLAPFRNFSFKSRLYTSWVGLRGAVPIVFVFYTIENGVEDTTFIFTVVFICTLCSLIVQGTTVSSMADWLKLSEKEPESTFSITTLSDAIRSGFTEIEVNEKLLLNGDTLASISLPKNTLAFVVSRYDEYIVPNGTTKLQVGDKLLLVSNNTTELREKARELGVENIFNVE
ncbi:MAG: potassium/proton antiporter [Alistipes sp.]|nr:potassium/proton antiporter [Candidatus Alistipes equi]